MDTMKITVTFGDKQCEFEGYGFTMVVLEPNGSTVHGEGGINDAAYYHLLEQIELQRPGLLDRYKKRAKDSAMARELEELLEAVLSGASEGNPHDE